jgi:hypothetical protein
MYAPNDKCLYIMETKPVRPYEALWNATCKVESDFNPYAIGDKHLKNSSYGIVQIRKTRLDDYYLQTGIKYSVKDMFDPIKSKKVFMHYASLDLEKTAREWNGGPKGMHKKSTIKYWKKIKKEML